MSNKQLILPLTERLRADFGLHAVTASEIEFYLPGSEGYMRLPELWGEVRAACASAGIPLLKIDKEKGRDQHEIALATADPGKTASDTQALKDILCDNAVRHGLPADFSAKAFADQPGSGLHIHLHLADASGRNVFFKDDAQMSEALRFSLGGLLAWLAPCMPIFAPFEASYARFVVGSNVPVTLSWGANNRTVALRLPDAPHDRKRIEHRVAGADADPARVIAVMLAAMHDGLVRRIAPSAQIYGDAALAQYNLPRLPATLREALAQFHAFTPLAEYFPDPAALLPTPESRQGSA